MLFKFSMVLGVRNGGWDGSLTFHWAEAVSVCTHTHTAERLTERQFRCFIMDVFDRTFQRMSFFFYFDRGRECKN